MPVTEWEDETETEEVEEVPPARPERLIEQYFVANLLARPDLVPAVQPDARSIQEPTVRAMLQAWAAHGFDAAYARPAPMMAALDVLPQTVDATIANDVLLLVPEPADVDLGGLLKLKADIDQAQRDRRLQSRVDRAIKQFGRTPNQMVINELREALNEYERGALTKVDNTTKGQLERLKNAPPKVRWKIGYGGVVCPALDEPLKGIGPDGQAGYGMLGQNEVVVVAAGYGVGKTRLVDNWKWAVLQQGGSVAHILLEDDETAAMTKLMGIHADLPFWMIEQFARGEVSFLGKDGLEKEQKLNEALSWYESLGDRYRVYDGSNTEANVFDFDEALALLELDARLYKTTHVIVDYVQAFDHGEEVEYAAKYAQRLRALAGRHKINVIEISQVSNETLKWGSAAGQVAAKGSGAWGQAAHLGFEIQWQPEVGQQEVRLALKKARNMRRRDTYARINEESGKIVAYYDTPMLMELPETKVKGGRK